ncbi:hypothetical protein C8A00DRAFT_17598 [Chaetomidium leptoderma]|uniref:Uncharacterized protein n=1 Tax=Chaetomidium leptoderma TaxID=669021 RepID=A0AAN6VGM6_9PEZI|nr:hypothetical protein C8A00DRAFT_17598 [Chaetomidium leptoderma]
MDTTQRPELGEKMRLQDHLRLQEQQQQVEQQQQQQEQQEQQPSPTSQSRLSPPSGSNSVPMTEEDLEFSLVHNPSPVPAPVYTTPPPYSGPSTPAQEPASAQDTPGVGGPKQPPRYPGLPYLDYRLYNPPLFDLSADKTTIKSSVPYLSTSAEALVALVRQQATVPPKPQIHIVGRRGSSPHSGRVDFSIRLNLLPLLVPEDSRQRMDYLRCVGPGEVALRGGSKPSTQPEVEGDGGLEAWAARFVADNASVKVFVLERVVANLDVDWLEGQIRKLVVGMRYPGTVAVSFPTTHARVVVQNPDRVNKFITSVTGFFAGKRKYEVVKAVWPFATMPSKGGDGDERRCAVQSEEVWWREWRGPILHAIATKRHGWVTNEDKLEALMEGTPSSTTTNVDWGPDGTI